MQLNYPGRDKVMRGCRSPQRNNSCTNELKVPPQYPNRPAAPRNRARKPVSRPGPRLAGPDAGETCAGVGGGYRSCPGPGRRYFDRRGVAFYALLSLFPLILGLLSLFNLVLRS